MKKHIFTRYNGLFLVPFILFLFGNHVHSQNVIYKSSQLSEHSIIRNYSKNVDITYSLNGDAYAHYIGFNYVDRSSMTVISAEIPLNYAINDFVVYNDSVFFCGCNYFTPIFGFFDIYDVFFNNGVINYYISPSIISSLDIIKAKRTSSGDLHMVMIGESASAKSSTGYLIADAWIDASGTMTFKYALENEDKYMYNDMALTDNYAVVSAIGSSNGIPNSHNIFYYNEPTASNGSYLNWPTNIAPLWQADPTTLLSSNAISITKMEQDMFATVCHSLTSGKIVVSIFNDPLNPPVNRFELPYDETLYDIIYNKLYKTLFLLPNGGHDLEFTKYPYASTTKATTPGGICWLSIDNADLDNHEIISGFESRIKHYWQFDMSSPNSCANYTTGNNADIPIFEQSLIQSQLIDRVDITPDSLPPHIETFTLLIDCQ